ncbi:uncharacterized protein STEHIDRAFT_136039 [Stereum hirsutum FP-91666 SS1]|uniref:uncharacterized protein n=1 Tax=Stereum hirsutum (strain FP-91666) TaxID=721885 RepID=UPI000440ED2F|nr:uncharacterized protein STEHIDRAFT_136039 [Stereum hirsutum FP-91666 SS1]EIM91941.1 hypothetical protein STEHIDRAFT_136039 [Stereum hirsutum FP-91666 SS1]
MHTLEGIRLLLICNRVLVAHMERDNIPLDAAAAGHSFSPDTVTNNADAFTLFSRQIAEMQNQLLSLQTENARLRSGGQGSSTESMSPSMSPPSSIGPRTPYTPNHFLYPSTPIDLDLLPRKLAFTPSPMQPSFLLPPPQPVPAFALSDNDSPSTSESPSKSSIEIPPGRFWKQKAWREAVESERLRKSVAKPEDTGLALPNRGRGKTRLAAGDNVMFGFLENMQGVVIDGGDVTSLRSWTNIWFDDRYAEGELPTSSKDVTWLRIGPGVRKRFRKDVRDAFTDLTFGENGWQIEAFMELQFPAWKTQRWARTEKLKSKKRATDLSSDYPEKKAKIEAFDTPGPSGSVNMEDLDPLCASTDVATDSPRANRDFGNTSSRGGDDNASIRGRSLESHVKGAPTTGTPPRNVDATRCLSATPASTSNATAQDAQDTVRDVVPHETEAEVMGVVSGQVSSSPFHLVSSSKELSISNTPPPDSSLYATGLSNDLPPGPTDKNRTAVLSAPFMENDILAGTYTQASTDSVLLPTESGSSSRMVSSYPTPSNPMSVQTDGGVKGGKSLTPGVKDTPKRNCALQWKAAWPNMTQAAFEKHWSTLADEVKQTYKTVK